MFFFLFECQQKKLLDTARLPVWISILAYTGLPETLHQKLKKRINIPCVSLYLATLN